MSQESSLMSKGVDDISEADMRELANWFRARGKERRCLLKRYNACRLKTEALAAKKVGVPLGYRRFSRRDAARACTWIFLCRNRMGEAGERAGSV